MLLTVLYGFKMHYLPRMCMGSVMMLPRDMLMICFVLKFMI